MQIGLSLCIFKVSKVKVTKEFYTFEATFTYAKKENIVKQKHHYIIICKASMKILFRNMNKITISNLI